ncbi:MAG: type IX secretion system plug protein domain-containing protein, partial [Flavobacteriales bacterium]
AYVPPGRQSYNTLQPFIHYELVLPNRDLRPTRSGNYLIKVYRGGDEDDLVLTRRLLVHEPLADVQARVAAPRQVDLRDAAQQVDLLVNTNRLPVQDPFAEVHAVLLQNFRWDDARYGAQPRFVRGTELVYDFPGQGLFMAGNEYRNFDLKDLRFATARVERIVPGPGQQPYEVWLVPELRRSIRRYNTMQDINGRYLVRNDDVSGDPLGADYALVRFRLPMEAPLMHDVYVYAQLSDWQCKPEFRMEWSEERRQYEAAILLKQGFYDFSFVTLPRKHEPPDITAIEGSHFEAENDYLVLVYFTDRMQRLDRLVGFRWANSRR